MTTIRCTEPGCRKKAVKILTIKDVRTDSINQWPRCSEHYLMLIVNLAGSVTHGQIFG